MREKASAAFLILLTFLSLLTEYLTLPYVFDRDDGETTQISEVLLTVDGVTKEAELPLTLEDLHHGTPVTVSFSLPVKRGDVLFFGSVYAPLTIEANGKKIYEYGSRESFPSFFKDPPTQYDSVILPPGKETKIRMRYSSPKERTSLSIHAPVAGGAAAVLSELLSVYGITMAAAMFFIMLGMLLSGISVLMFRPSGREPNSISFLYPGLLFLFSGAWQFGENPLSVYLLQCPALLYVMDFLGLFLLMVPLYRMGIDFLNLKSNLLLRIFLLLIECSVIAAIVLQLTRTVSFHRSLYYFHILLPLSLLVLTATALYEFLRYRNRMAGLFFVPFLILAFSSVMELANYYLRFFPQFSALFQVGLFIFVISMAAFANFYAQSLTNARIRSLALENEVKVQEQVIAAQKSRNELLLTHFEEIRRQRHDVRHHLGTIGEMVKRGETNEVLNYIQSLTDSVPAYTPEVFCENDTLNATLSFYVQQIRELGIEPGINVQIPGENPDISDANLCVIFGNLLENAMEACRRMTTGRRCIRLNAQIRGEVLFIVMENSFDGNARKYEDLFYSSKRSGVGTGLRSIKTLAELHNGGASFREEGKMFRSEVYVRL